MATRDHLRLLINGLPRQVRGEDCFLSLSDYLRRRLGLAGTKVVCSEGDCGSCTVLVGRPANGEIRYRPIDSCLCWMFQLDGTHVVTVEGLNGGGRLTSVQQALVDCHGSQCGFCTPGFVMAMTALCEESATALTTVAWREGLAGNLCRCTGYAPILRAGAVAQAEGPLLEKLYPSQHLLRELSPYLSDTLDVMDPGETGVARPRRAYCPTTLDGALRFLQDHPTAKVIAGATDVGVQLNKRLIAPELFLDLNRIAELEQIEIASDAGSKSIIAGARATWTRLLDVCRQHVPQLAEIISVFGSPQIRHVGTLGGNIINASPIADSLPFLCVTEAELELVSSQSSRRVNINRFYRGYKQCDLRPGELLTSVRIPLPPPNQRLRLYKVSRRRDLDIATFSAAIGIRLDGPRIAEAALAYGGVGPTVVRLEQTQDFLRGRPFDEATLRAAGEVAVGEIAPIGDVRGSREYRQQLARNVLLKFYHEQAVDTAVPH